MKRKDPKLYIGTKYGAVGEENYEEVLSFGECVTENGSGGSRVSARTQSDNNAIVSDNSSSILDYRTQFSVLRNRSLPV